MNMASMAWSAATVLKTIPAVKAAMKPLPPSAAATV
jgi:hypothetical protein